MANIEENVTLINSMGSDLTVVNAARVSFSKESTWDVCTYMDMDGSHGQNKFLNAADIKLIKYLAKHNHWSPFSHPQIQFRIKMPIFIARQWFKHTVGFARNEVSRRYVSDEPEFWNPGEWRKKHENKKQGSSESEIVTNLYFNEGENKAILAAAKPENAYAKALGACYKVYEVMIQNGICPEQARMVLPQSMYTEFYETGSLAAYCRLLNLRLKPDTQLETRMYAAEIARHIEQLFPESYKALINQ